VELGDDAVAALLDWGTRQAQERENAQEAWIGDGHVFTMEDGRAIDLNYPTRYSGSSASRRTVALHPFAWTQALLHSPMIAAGTDIAVVSKLAGHSSIAITADVYGHLVGTVASGAVNPDSSHIAHMRGG
jgi:hypothetical protein